MRSILPSVGQKNRRLQSASINMRTVAMTYENSEVDGSDWPEDRFAALDFDVELYPDTGYPQGCLKYVPCAMDDDPTCGHRVRSKFPDAKPVQVDGVWVWQVNDLGS
jgi:hypothetical protein